MSPNAPSRNCLYKFIKRRGRQFIEQHYSHFQYSFNVFNTIDGILNVAVKSKMLDGLNTLLLTKSLYDLSCLEIAWLKPNM